jgi:antitoxin component of RelBE/YafQ-DinJ toxin-antitoxin module
MKTQVLYARVEEDLKAEVDEFAKSRGVTITSALTDLVTRGLAAISEEESISRLEMQLVQARTEQTNLLSELRASKIEGDTVRALTQRSNHPIGNCVACGVTFSGYELLAVGQCSNGHPLAEALSLSPKASSTDQRDFLLFLGALGAVLGVAYLATRP